LLIASEFNIIFGDEIEIFFVTCTRVVNFYKNNTTNTAIFAAAATTTIMLMLGLDHCVSGVNAA